MGLDTSLFVNLQRYIFLYYFITVVLFGAAFWYFQVFVGLNHPTILLLVFLMLVSIFGVVIAKFATEPLEEYLINLEALSKETLHELNLPLATIKANVDMLEKTHLDEKSSKRLERIKKACDMLTERYNELDYMIKTQTKKEERECFDLKELVQERVSFMQTLHKDVSFTCDLENCTINLDKIGLSKAIDNLIDNGIKYSIEIKKIDITLKEKRLSIKDHGIGIDEVALLKVFDRYYQKDESMPGFGIGLSMVKRFCDTNGIKLHIASKKGSTTTLFLDFKGVICKQQTF